jgi:hypothetical protein
MAGPGKRDNSEVVALGLEPVQERDTLVDRDLSIGGAIEPQGRDPELLQVWSWVRA